MHKDEKDAFDAVDAVMGIQPDVSELPSGPVAVVNPDDLKSVYRVYEDFAARHPDGKAALGAGVLEQVCGPGANVFALWYRYTMVKLLAKFSAGIPENPFAPWIKDGQWHDAVFKVGSKSPMEWIGRWTRKGLPFDVEAFLAELKKEAA